MDALLGQSRVLADRLRKARHVKVVSHIDADGITSAAVAVKALQRLGIDYEVEYLKSLRPQDGERLLNENPDTLWFTDLGSGAAAQMQSIEPVITDHHVPSAGGKYHLNCHFMKEDGSRYLSGSTTTYLVARQLDRANRDMAGVALVGAVGDLQDSDAGRLTGANRVVVEDAAQAGVVGAGVDARYFGRETRVITRLLQYADDPCVPGVSGRHGACCAFLESMEVPYKDHDGNDRQWVTLTKDEKQRVLSAVAKSLLEKGYGHKSVDRLVGEVYVLRSEAQNTPVRDAKEFATLLNSTARYDEADVGLQVALGDRDENYAKALELLKGHRANLVAGIKYVQEQGVTERDHLQYFHAKDAIRETIVGIVAGMLFNGGTARRDRPIIGFAYADGAVKVSGRANRALVEAGVNLAEVMREASAAVGGAGGGHAPAAGATIPAGREDAFIEEAERVLKRQLTG